jgi:hypothetical protein
MLITVAIHITEKPIITAINARPAEDRFVKTLKLVFRLSPCLPAGSGSSSGRIVMRQKYGENLSMTE